MNFSIKRFLSIFNARNKEFYRDKGAMGWTFLFPLLVVFGFSYLFNMGGNGLYKVGVVGEDLKINNFLSKVQYTEIDDAVKKLEHHKVDLIVDNTEGEVKHWVNKNSPKSLIAEQLYLNKNQNIESNPNRKVVDTRLIKYVDWLFPGLLAMNVLWMALWGVGWVVVRQRKLGILKRFKASPLTPLEYLLAQMSSRLVILCITGITIFVGSHLIYPFQTKGSYLSLFAVYILGCLAMSSIGLIIAARISSDEFANCLLNLFTYPMMFLSEVWFSLEGSSETIKFIAKLSPLWHMTNCMRKIMNEGATLIELKSSIIILLLTFIIFTAIGSSLFKWTKD